MTDLPIAELRELLASATARPWVAFDDGDRILALMKGRRPADRKARWQEIIKWTGFDASDVPWRYRRANLHLIVEAINALPALLDEIERLQAALKARHTQAGDGE